MEVGYTPKSDRAIEQHWSKYQSRVRARVEKGKQDYGDVSFGRPLADCIDELQQEIEDLNGWGFVIWSRLEDLRLRQAIYERDGK